jgi:hypothetical protein
MSVTVSAVPFILLFTVTKGAIEFIEMTNDIKQATQMKDGYNLHIEDNIAEKLFNKELETQILDKDLLLKTLEEHGAINIQEDDNEITCDCEAFHLCFYRTENNPYHLKISYNSANNLNEFVEDIGNEYTINAQEISYNKIKERLEKQNHEIENEEIYDDNTIVLTVNLE